VVVYLNYLKIAEEDFLTLIYEKMNTDKPTTAEEVMEVMAFHKAKERRLEELNKQLERENLTEEEKAKILIHIKAVKRMDFLSFKLSQTK
jgi:precorrin-3B methylase